MKRIFPILIVFIVLSVVAICFLAAQHEENQKQTARKNFEDAMNPERDQTFRLNEVIETIQGDSAEEMKNNAWLDKELDKSKQGSEIVDQVNEVLRRRMAQEISTRTNTVDVESRLTKQDIEQINLWEKAMEQKILQTVVESEKHGADSKEIEDAVALTLQLKQQDKALP